VPHATALGDDNTATDDEDGVTLPAQFIRNQTASLTVNASAPAA
jgi:hypothetical protein